MGCSRQRGAAGAGQLRLKWRYFSPALTTDNEFTRILQWPGYRVYQQRIDEKHKLLELWVRRKRGNRKLECSDCGQKFADAYDSNERAVRDLPCAWLRPIAPDTEGQWRAPCSPAERSAAPLARPTHFRRLGLLRLQTAC
jgi:hypothetical protein